MIDDNNYLNIIDHFILGAESSIAFRDDERLKLSNSKLVTTSKQLYKTPQDLISLNNVRCVKSN
jgi:hypothetical protein